MFIYDADTLTTRVTACEAAEDGRFWVTLRETCFYAAAGGQPDDQGEIAGQAVLALHKLGGVTHHLLGAPVAGEVFCRIDSERRARHSLLHSAQHLTSAVFDQIGSHTASFHIGGDQFSIDLSGVHTREALDEQELLINRLVWRALPIGRRMYDPGVDHDLVLADGLTPDTAVIVTIGDFDRNACGGTHLTNTADIKLIKILRHKPSRGGTRVWVTAGEAAFRHLQFIQNRDEAMRRVLNVEEGQELLMLETKLKENKKLQKELSKLKPRPNQPPPGHLA